MYISIFYIYCQWSTCFLNTYLHTKLHAFIDLLIFVFHQIIIALQTVCSTGQTTEDPICQEPLDLPEKIRSILIQPRNRHILLLLGMQDNRTFFPTQDQVVSSGNGCPEQTEKSGHIPGRSLCPWYIDMNRQRDRIPYLIPYARCKCRRCLNVPVDSPLNRFARCEYHYYHMQVLRRLSCKNGFYIYKAFWEQVPVACICAHRKIAVTGWNRVARLD